jgi:hypothetical protein
MRIDPFHDNRLVHLRFDPLPKPLVLKNDVVDGRLENETGATCVMNILEVLGGQKKQLLSPVEDIKWLSHWLVNLHDRSVAVHRLTI